MDTKSNKSKKTLLLRDFVMDEQERMVYSSDDYDLLFFSSDGEKPKRYIQVWYKEKDKRYLRDESIMDWQILRYRRMIDKRNVDFWNRINNFYQEYFNE